MGSCKIVTFDEPIPIMGGKPAERSFDEPFPRIIGGNKMAGATGSAREHGTKDEFRFSEFLETRDLQGGGVGEREKVKDMGTSPDSPEVAGDTSTDESEECSHVSRGVITRSWTWSKV